MTVQASEKTQAASCHQSGATRSLGDGTQPTAAAKSASLVASIAMLPRNVKIMGGAVLVFGALLAIGVPLAVLTPLLAIGGCLGMHLFMPGMHGGHGGHDEHQAHDEASGDDGAANRPQA